MSEKASVRDWEVAVHFWRAMWHHKTLFLVALIFPLGVVATGILSPFYIGHIFAALATPGGKPEHYLVMLVVIAFLGIIANRYGFKRLMRLQAVTMSDLQHTTLESLLRRSVGFHNNNISGKLVSDAIDYPAAFLQLSGAVLVDAIPFVLVIVSGIAIIFTKSWQMGLMLTAMVTITLAWAFAESRTRSSLRAKRLAASKELTAHLSDTIINTQTVKTFAREAYEMKEHSRLNNALTKLRLNDWQRAATSGNNRIGALTFMQILFIAGVITLVRRDPSLLGIGIFAFTYTLTLINRLFDINIMLRTIEEAILNASPMIAILQETPEILDSKQAPKLNVGVGLLEFKEVGFKYQDSNSEELIFDNLNLAIAPKEKIGLVGPSGGGKSTLTRLLLRFEDIQSGEILIDGQNINAVTQKSLRQAISYVPQEPLLFHRTIRENISYGHPDATEAEIIEAARKAFALEFIQALPKQFDTIVGERGIKLSGGQRQRIAIARAILKNAPILLLDEATSALDSESEKVIQEALWELMQDRTVLVIAHRLSTIQRMDRIVLLDDGKIIEEGSHKQLLDHNGLYAKLWSHQSGGFIEE